MNYVLENKLAAELRDLYENDDVARTLFDDFSIRKNDIKVTTARRGATLAGGVTRAEIIALFRKLAEIGLGEFKIGRRGSATRIEWGYSVRSIGAAAQGKINKVEDIDASSVGEFDTEITEDEDIKSDCDKENSIEHIFQLRHAMRVSIRLPPDFTAKEAERLAGFVRQLPFGEE